MICKKIIFSALIVILSLTGMGLGCKQKPQSQSQNNQTESSLFTAEPQSFDENFNQLKAGADSQAQAWQNSTRLIYVITKIPQNLSPDQVQHTFVYESDQIPGNWWTIAIDSGTHQYIRAIIPKADFLGSGYQQILPVYWKVNFAAALQKAESNGGTDFRAQHAGDYQIELDLFRSTSASLRWKCKYSTIDNKTVKEIFVDASSGEIIDAGGEAQS